MNDEDENMSTSVYSYATNDTITIDAGDLTSINLGDITLSTTPTKSWDSFSDVLGTLSKTTTSTVHDLDIDPFAAIIQLKRTGVFPDIDMIKRCTPSSEYVELSRVIREYYLDKIITQKLSSNYRESEFKKDMVKALKLSGKCVLEEPHIRLLYRLDDFYTEDTFLENISREYKQIPDSPSTIALDRTPITFIGSINVFRRGSRVTHFYFKTVNNYVIRLKGPMNDWLMPITAVFKHVKQVIVSGSARPTPLTWDNKFKIGELNIKYTVDGFNF